MQNSDALQVADRDALDQLVSRYLSPRRTGPSRGHRMPGRSPLRSIPRPATRAGCLPPNRRGASNLARTRVAKLKLQI